MAALTSQTKTTIGTAIIVAGFAFGGWQYLENRFGSITSRFTELETRLAEGTGDRFTKTAAAEQALRMAIENPGIKVPDPRDPNRIIEVRSVVSTGAPTGM